MSINHRSGSARVGLVAIVMALAAASWTAIGAQRDGRGTAPAAAQNFPSTGLDRMQPIPPEKMTPAQKKAVEEYAKIRPGGTLNGQPWTTMLRVPEIVAPALQLRTHLNSPQVALPPKLVEFATLISAAEWTNNWEWGGHSQAAVREGLKPDIVAALAEGRRPTGMAEDEEIVYDFCTELFKHQSVSDYTYNRALAKFGEPGIVETAHIAGLSTMMAMMMNAVRVQARIPEGSKPPLVPYPHTLPVPTIGRASQ
jgi:4-carboxymuconolactone decarboxylase